MKPKPKPNEPPFRSKMMKPSVWKAELDKYADRKLEEGRVFLLIVPFVWGKGKTILEAIENVKKSGGGSDVKMTWILFDVDADAYVDDYGGTNWKSGKTPPVEIARWKKEKK